MNSEKLTEEFSHWLPDPPKNHHWSLSLMDDGYYQLFLEKGYRALYSGSLCKYGFFFITIRQRNEITRTRLQAAANSCISQHNAEQDRTNKAKARYDRDRAREAR